VLFDQVIQEARPALRPRRFVRERKAVVPPPLEWLARDGIEVGNQFFSTGCHR